MVGFSVRTGNVDMASTLLLTSSITRRGYATRPISIITTPPLLDAVDLDPLDAVDALDRFLDAFVRRLPDLFRDGAAVRTSTLIRSSSPAASPPVVGIAVEPIVTVGRGSSRILGSSAEPWAEIEEWEGIASRMTTSGITPEQTLPICPARTAAGWSGHVVNPSVTGSRSRRPPTEPRRERNQAAARLRQAVAISSAPDRAPKAVPCSSWSR